MSLVIQTQDRFSRRKAQLEVTRGEIRIGKELTDFQFLLRENFFTCYVIGVIILYTFQLTGLLLMRVYWKQRQRARILRQMQEEQQEDPSEILDLDESQLERDGEDEQGTSSSNNEWEEMPQQQEAATDSVGRAEWGDRPVHGQPIPESAPATTFQRDDDSRIEQEPDN